MRKIFTDALTAQLKPLFAKEFPDFKPFRPKLTAEEKEEYALPASTVYFSRTNRGLTEFLGIRRYTHDGWTLEILWSRLGHFPVSSLLKDYGLIDLNELVLKPEVHTASGSFGASNWYVWRCSVPAENHEFFQRYSREYSVPIDPARASEVVATKLQETVTFIRSCVLPLFAEAEMKAGR